MTTPFWQIRNRKLLNTFKPHMGTLEDSYRDLSRGDMNCIKLDGIPCTELFIEQLNIKPGNKTSEELAQEITQSLTKEHIKKVIKTKLFSFIRDEALLEQYAVCFSKILHQSGLIYAAAQAFTKQADIDHGFVTRKDTVVSIYAWNKELFIEEKTIVQSLSKAESRYKSIKVSEAILLANDDNSPIVTLKNRFHLVPLPDGDIAYRHTDLTVEYNHPGVQELFDKRSLIQKIIDLFKSIFELNGIEEFKLDNEESLHIRS